MLAGQSTHIVTVRYLMNKGSNAKRASSNGEEHIAENIHVLTHL